MISHASVRRAFLVLAAIGVLGTLSGSWSAQITSSGTVFGSAPNSLPPSDETLHVEAGDILELFPVIDGGAESYAWVFTKDRTFLEATREKIFRARQVIQGEYHLDATVNTGADDRQYRRNFNVSIGTHDATWDPATQTMLLQTVPATIDDTVELPASLQVVKLIPDRSQVSKFGISLDRGRADSGSTLPIDNAETYSYTDATPLWLWFPVPRERVMQITMQKIDGTTETRRIRISVRPAEDPVVTGNGILAVTQDNGSIRFSVETDRQTPNTVTYWDFGDGMQSMLEQPAHIYRHDGVYTVSATVRDLDSGKVTFRAQTVMAVSWTNASSSSVANSSEASTSTSSSSSSAAAGSGSTVQGGFGLTLSSGTLRLIIIVFCILVMLGVLVWLFIAFLRRSGRSLESTVASAEALILKNPPSSNVTEPPPPMELRRRPAKAEVEQQIVDVTPVEKKEQQPAPAPPPAEIVDMTQAPAWLKKGLEKPEPEPSKSEEVTPVPEPTPEPAPIAPAQDTQMEPVSTPDLGTPPWMEPQQASQQQEAPVQPENDAAPIVQERTDAAVELPANEPGKEEVLDPTEPTPQEQPSALQASSDATEEAPVITNHTEPEDEKAAREREKKRLKRMRYRANLKKRKTEDKTPVQNGAEPIVDAKARTEVPAPAAPPKELPAAVPAPELAAPVEPLELTAANPATELPAPAAPAPQAPPATPKNDEEVKFVISADSVTPPPEGPAQPST